MQSNQNVGEPRLRPNPLAELKKNHMSVRFKSLGVWVINAADMLRAVGSWVKKWNSVPGPRRAADEKEVASDIPAKPLEQVGPTDSDIASAAALQIDRMTSIPSGVLEITVNQGRVTLEGDVEWDYQRTAAGNAVQYLTAVKEVRNLIGLRLHADSAGASARVLGIRARSQAFLSAKLGGSAASNEPLLD